MDIEAARKRVGQLIVELQALERMLSEGSPSFPDAMQELVSKGLCLNCKEPLSSKKTRAVRGNHESCYREIMREISAGKLTESEAISQGLILPAVGGGRPTKMTRVKELVQNKALTDKLAEGAAVGKKKAKGEAKNE